MFDLTVRAFNVADRYRLPVLVMADEVVGHMVERVVIPPEEEIELWTRKRPGQDEERPASPFQPVGDDLVPPMMHAGEGYRVHFTGLTHDVRGYPEMDAETHHALVKRLVDKVRVNAGELIQLEEHFMDGARIVVIAFGSTARSARRAVKDARAAGIPVGFLRMISLWPFPEDRIRQLGGEMDALIVAEMNLGQIRREVERFARCPVDGVHHAGGAMMPPGPIYERIEEVGRRGNGSRR
jgi:2-oxoglutarate ferredoxin oxidoreductase subunit alpha